MGIQQQSILKKCTCLFGIAVSLVICIFWSFTPGLSANESRKVRIAVLNFEAAGAKDRTGEWAAACTEWMQSYLVATSRFDIVERVQIQKIIAEQALGQSGRIDPETAAKTGKLLGVDIMLIGRLIPLGTEIEVVVRLVDVHTGIIFDSFYSQVENPMALKGTLNDIASSISFRHNEIDTDGRIKKWRYATSFSNENITIDFWTPSYGKGMSSEEIDNIKVEIAKNALHINGCFHPVKRPKRYFSYKLPAENYAEMKIRFRLKEIKGNISICQGNEWGEGRDSYELMCMWFNQELGEISIIHKPTGAEEETESPINLSLAPGMRYEISLQQTEIETLFYFGETLIASRKHNQTPADKLNGNFYLLIIPEGTKSFHLVIDELLLR